LLVHLLLAGTLRLRTQVILNPNGSGGDVHPFLAIGQELQRLGHHVGVMTNPRFQPQIGQAGLEFIPLGTVEGLELAGGRLQHQKSTAAWQVALEWTARISAEAVDYLEQRRLRYPTLFVGSPLSFGMRLVAERYSLPMATLILSPYVLRSCQDSPCMPPLWLGRGVPAPLKALQYWVADRWAIDPLLQPLLGPLRCRLGLPPQRRWMQRWCFSPTLNLGCFPPWFAPTQPDWPTGFQHVGPVHWDPPPPSAVTTPSASTGERPTSADTTTARVACGTSIHQAGAVASSGNRCMGILAGSAGPPSANFYQVWIEATAALGCHLFIIEPDRAWLPPTLPSHVRVATYAPLEPLLPQLDCLIHSGSISATLRCAAAGVPQLVCPRFNDQFDNAARVQRLGLGLALPPAQVQRLSSIQAQRIGYSLFTNLPQKERCQQVARLPQASGARAAAAQIDAAFRQEYRQT